MLLTPFRGKYGVVVLGVNWVPGVIAAIHMVTTYRSTILLFHFLVWLFFLMKPTSS